VIFNPALARLAETPTASRLLPGTRGGGIRSAPSETSSTACAGKEEEIPPDPRPSARRTRSLLRRGGTYAPRKARRTPACIYLCIYIGERPAGGAEQPLAAAAGQEGGRAKAPPLAPLCPAPVFALYFRFQEDGAGFGALHCKTPFSEVFRCRRSSSAASGGFGGSCAPRRGARLPSASGRANLGAFFSRDTAGLRFPGSRLSPRRKTGVSARGFYVSSRPRRRADSPAFLPRCSSRCFPVPLRVRHPVSLCNPREIPDLEEPTLPRRAGGKPSRRAQPCSRPRRRQPAGTERGFLGLFKANPIRRTHAGPHRPERCSTEELRAGSAEGTGA